jgi:hypothetical protein
MKTAIKLILIDLLIAQIVAPILIMLPVLYGQNFCKQIRLRSIYF